MDPLRTTNPAEELSGPERDARVDHLLLAGLDEYFAGNYEQAITLWTRVLFLDRRHDRARAYIDRARSAQAERHRESEAVLHEGIAAFHDGDVGRARRLVADALERGASRDDVQGLIDRIDRLGLGQTLPVRRRAAPKARARDARLTAPSARPRRVGGPTAVALLLAAALGVLAVGVVGFTLPEPGAWTIFGGAARNAALPAVSTTPAPLPLARASEVFLARARSLFATGRLREAGEQADRIPIGDPLRGAADRLRADIQRELLAVATSEQQVASAPGALLAPRPPE